MKHSKLSKKIISKVLLLATIVTMASVNGTALAATKTSNVQNIPKSISKLEVVEKHDEILDAQKLYKIAKEGKDENIKVKKYDSNGKIKAISQVVGKYKDPSTDMEVTETNLTTFDSIKIPNTISNTEDNSKTKEDTTTSNIVNGMYTFNFTPKALFGEKSESDDVWDRTDAVHVILTTKFYTYNGSDGNKYIRLEYAIVDTEN